MNAIAFAIVVAMALLCDVIANVSNSTDKAGWDATALILTVLFVVWESRRDRAWCRSDSLCSVRARRDQETIGAVMTGTPTPRDQIAAALWENGRLAHLGEPPWSELDDDRRGVPYEEADLILSLPFITEMQERVKRVDIDKAFHDVVIAERNLAWYQFGKRDARIAELEAALVTAYGDADRLANELERWGWVDEIEPQAQTVRGALARHADAVASRRAAGQS